MEEKQVRESGDKKSYENNKWILRLRTKRKETMRQGLRDSEV